jgi:hypothetical protein
MALGYRTTREPEPEPEPMPEPSLQDAPRSELVAVMEAILALSRPIEIRILLELFRLSLGAEDRVCRVDAIALGRRLNYSHLSVLSALASLQGLKLIGLEEGAYRLTFLQRRPKKRSAGA